MLKDVCSSEGEKLFVFWIIEILKVSEINALSKIEDYKDNLSEINGLSKGTIKIFYELMSIKSSYGIPFDIFYEMLLNAALELELPELTANSDEVLVNIEVIDLMATQYVRGFSKLVVDIGYEDLI